MLAFYIQIFPLDTHCRPEVCRNFNFGKEGSSEGEAYDAFLAPIRLNTEAVPWRELNLTYLEPNRWAAAPSK